MPISTLENHYMITKTKLFAIVITVANHITLIGQNFDQTLTVDFIKTNWKIEHDLVAIHVIPKCGTHFIQHTLNLMTDKVVVNSNVSPEKLAKTCLENKILRTFQPYSEKTAKMVHQLGHKLIAVVRDPRDALISHLFYMQTFKPQDGNVRTRRDFFTVGENFDDLELKEQLNSLINGENGCMSYIDFYKSRVGWALNSNCLVIKYEDLLGNEGGGEDAKQRQTVKKIARFINLQLSDEKLNFVVQNMYKSPPDRVLSNGQVLTK